MSSPSPLPPDLGPSVVVFSPDMPASAIQGRIADLYAAQKTAQFGPGRWALAFLPGTYDVDVPLGFHTQVIGLGATPADVVLRGGPRSEPWLPQNNATCNFWRGFENLTVVPRGGPLLWAVSQGCPVRRVHIQGDLALSLQGGWSSGGFLADSVVEGTVDSGTQQQWLTRNCRLGAWTGHNWNMVFVGTEGVAARSPWPHPPYTVVDRAPLVQEKPFLALGPDGRLEVRVPALRSGASGPSWTAPGAPDRVLSLEAFHLARPGVDTAETLNRALAAGRHLLFTPGLYDLEEALRVDRPGTVVLGLGFASLRPVRGTAALEVADVDGVSLAGLLIEAGPLESPVLVRLGPEGSRADHSARPTAVHDLWVRIGGPGPGRVKTALTIGSRHVLGDHLWLWRADHGEGVGWDLNPADQGLRVTGDDVTLYGLFAEHFRQTQVLWAGEGGRVFFYQSEIPYDVAHQDGWSDRGQEGFAAYEVGPGVSCHRAWGLGIYCYFRDNPALRLGAAVRTSGAPGVRLQDLTTVSLGGFGEITSVVDGRGGPANKANTVARWKDSQVQVV